MLELKIIYYHFHKNVKNFKKMFKIKNKKKLYIINMTYNLDIINLFINQYINDIGLNVISKNLNISLQTLYRWEYLYSNNILNQKLVNKETIDKNKKLHG